RQASGIFRAREARDTLPEGLRERGARVEVVPVYRTLPEKASPSQLAKLENLDAALFTSSSTVEQFFKMVGKPRALKILGQTQVASIGPITSRTLEDYGLRVDVCASSSTVPDLIQALIKSTI
ncbi:MAG: uroporphyrinogen-III synthase, partial [Candidatus Omnitrophica bacterium]|nr:uroporphyrinogen-III synthase [Candidatus Omnitrophota bacterium]